MNLLARDLWEDVRQAFQTTEGTAVGDLWLQNVRPLEFSRGVFTLGVPNDVVRQWLEHRYRTTLESIFRSLTGSSVRVMLQLDPSLPLRRPARKQSAAGRPVPPLLMVRPENRLANAAIKRLLGDPASGNPLFLYGPTGSGKTELVRQHMRDYCGAGGSARSTVSLTAEAFSSGFVSAARERAVPAFRGRLLAADALVLEEAHRLRGKARSQKEFLSILKYYVARNRPVILTSRHPPNAIFLLDEGLRSHFLSGILVPIRSYSVPSRVAVLEAHARRFPREIPLETIERIAQRIPGTFDRQVRFLERVAAFAALEQKPASLEFLAQGFPELAGQGERDVDLKSLIQLVADEFGTRPEEIASNHKVRSAVLARHLVIYLATVVFNLKARRVMRHLGGLSPSTTAYARRKIEQRRKQDVLFDARVKRVLEQLNVGQKLLF